MKKQLDWKQIGQFFSVLLSVFTIIRDTFKEMQVGIEIIPWLVGDGREYFVEKFLKPLGTEFLSTRRIEVLSETVIMVNLDVAPKLPFNGAQIEENKGGDWVKIEKRKDGLYVDGRKIILYLSERQKDGKVIRGHKLREEVSGKPVLHPNILDALLEHTHLIPEEWKKNADGKIIFIFFWAVIFRDPSDGNLYVRSLYFRGGQWYSNYFWLDNDWNGHNPSALLASN